MDVVNVAVLVFVPCELRPGAILAQGMQALGVIRNKGLDRTLLWSRRCGLKGFVTGLIHSRKNRNGMSKHAKSSMWNSALLGCERYNILVKSM